MLLLWGHALELEQVKNINRLLYATLRILTYLNIVLISYHEVLDDSQC